MTSKLLKTSSFVKTIDNTLNSPSQTLPINSPLKHASNINNIDHSIVVQLQHSFDQKIMNAKSSNDFYVLYQEIIRQSHHSGVLVLNRMRKWMGDCAILSDEYCKNLKSEVAEPMVKVIFRHIENITPYYLPHFRCSISFGNRKVPKHLIPAPSWVTHRYAMLAHGLAHPSLQGLLHEIYRENRQENTSLWKVVDEKIYALCQTFVNPYQVPYLRGINPTLGTICKRKENVEIHLRVNFMTSYMHAIVHGYMANAKTDHLPDDNWVTSKLESLVNSSERHILLYAWLTWKDHLLNQDYFWLCDPKLETIHLSSTPKRIPHNLDDITPKKSAHDDFLPHVSTPVDTISELCSVPEKPSPSKCDLRANNIEPKGKPSFTQFSSPLIITSKVDMESKCHELPSNELRTVIETKQTQAREAGRDALPTKEVSIVEESSARQVDARSNLVDNSRGQINRESVSSQSKNELLQSKSNYYRLKNARKVLKDIEKGLINEEMFSEKELRDLRKRCYETMMSG